MKATAQGKALSLKKESLLRQLGEASFAKHGDNSGPDALVRPISDGLFKADSLDQEILRLSKVGQGRLVTPKRILAGMAGLGAGIILLASLTTGGSDAKDSPDGSDAKVGIGGAASEQASAVSVPDFSKVNYNYDFSEDDYEAVPPGRRRRSGPRSSTSPTSTTSMRGSRPDREMGRRGGLHGRPG